jgi:hypothetical protein
MPSANRTSLVLRTGRLLVISYLKAIRIRPLPIAALSFLYGLQAGVTYVTVHVVAALQLEPVELKEWSWCFYFDLSICSPLSEKERWSFGWVNGAVPRSLLKRIGQLLPTPLCHFPPLPYSCCCTKAAKTKPRRVLRRAACDLTRPNANVTLDGRPDDDG